MGLMRRGVLTAGAALLIGAPAASGAPYAGFGDPVRVGSAPAGGDVIDAAPLPHGQALLAILRGTSLVAADTADPAHAKPLGQAWDAAALTWPDGRSLVASVGPDGARVGGRAVGDGAPGNKIQGIARPDGSAVVAWSSGTTEPHALHAALIGADGTPGPVADLGTAGTFTLAGGTDGTAGLAWSFAGAAVQVAALAPTATAWSAPRQVGNTTSAPVPAVAVAPDGVVLVDAGGGRVARTGADGAQLPDQPAPVAVSALAVAGDGTTVFASPATGGWSLGGVRADGTALPAAPLVRDDVTYGDVAVHAWPGGAAVQLDRTWVGDSSAPYASFAVRDAAGRSDGTVLATGPGLAGFPDAAPGSYTAYAVDHGALVRITRPGAPARRPAKLTLTAGQLRPSLRLASFHLAADQVGTATITARVRRGAHGRWHAITPTGGGRLALLPLSSTWLRLPLPGKGSVCTGGVPWTVDVSVRFANRAGVRGRGALRFAQSCQVRQTKR